MIGSQNNIWKFMVGVNQYFVPCFQRNYSWTVNDCEGLYEDMLNLFEQRASDPAATHFIGSVVLQESPDSQSSILIIDGQQRLTTMYLFYLALFRAAKEKAQQGGGDYSFADKINIRILENDDEAFSSGQTRLHRFELSSQTDQDALDKLFEGNEESFIEDSLLTKTYRYFYQHLMSEELLSLKQFYDLTQILSFIEIRLGPGDDAQRIFESLNSKGVALTVSDKVRNYILMQFPRQEVARYQYLNRWVPMEQNCQNGSMDDFLFSFLAIKRSQPPKNNALYFEFKNYHGAKHLDNAKLMEELVSYSDLYARNKNCTYELFKNNDKDLSRKERISLQHDIEQCLYRLAHFIVFDVRIPFIMQCMWLHKHGKISGFELLEALKMVESLLFRRWVCAVPSNNLRRFFAALPRRVDEKQEEIGFINKLAAVLLDDKARCPNDEHFKKCLNEKDFYKVAYMLPYVIERLESLESREQADIYNNKTLTCEHIMPQTLNDPWREELGPDAEAIHEEWQHLLANLTLTSYNSNYSNRPFAEKCSMEHGFASSPLHTNRAIAQHEHWRLEDLQQRAQELGEKACLVWPYPTVSKS